MKRLIHLCTLLAVLLLGIALLPAAYGAGSVTYDENADKFIFAPGTAHAPTSLFTEFQSIMPGDTRTEQIAIKNDTANGVKIKVYMRSLGAQQNTDALLAQLTLTVSQQGDSVLFAAPANETAQLTDWVYLGTVYSGGEITLNVSLHAPVTLGNDFQHKVGYIDWQFKVEELPVEPTDPEAPQTGGTSHIFLYACLMCGSLVLLLLLFVLRKRKK